MTTTAKATNNKIAAKVGVATATCLFGIPLPGSLSSGLVLCGPYTISDAAKNGGITKIATVIVLH